MLLESDLRDFAANYDEQVRELVVLIADAVHGSEKFGKSAWIPYAPLVAYIDMADGSLHGSVQHPRGVLKWLSSNDERGWRFDIKGTTIYRVNVRPLKEGPDAENSFLLTEVLDCMPTHPRLSPIREEYFRPFSFTDPAMPGAEFVLVREFDWFDGTVDWLGKDITVYLDCDVDDKYSASCSLGYFKEIYANRDIWEAKFKTWIADEMTDEANKWQEHSGDYEPPYKPMTKQEFVQRLSLSDINLYANGHFDAYYSDDNIFFGHVIAIEGNMAGQLEKIYLTG